MRSLVLVFWVFVVIVALFKLRVYLEAHGPSLNPAVVKDSGPSSAEQPFVSREFDDFLLRFVRTWDFTAFRESVDPAVLENIPEEGLRTLFQGIAYRLGPLVYYRGAQLAAQKPALNGELIRAEAVFIKGEAVLEVEIVRKENRFFIQSFTADSGALEGLEAAAREASQSGRINAVLFRQKIAS